MPKPKELDVASFAAEVLEAAPPVLVDFWSRTCPHCLHLDPHFEAAAEAAGDEVRFAKICVQDDAMPLFQQYHVSGVPTLILFREGKELARRSGATTAQEIAAWLAQHL